MPKLTTRQLKKHLTCLGALHGGKLTPDIIVQDATSRLSPLFGLFQISDEHAARRLSKTIHYQVEELCELWLP